MKLLSISLSNNRGTLELRGVLKDFSTGEIAYQVLANDLPFCETPFYEDARAVLMDVFELNNPNRESMQ